MGCVHTHWGIFAIEGWGSLSNVRSVMKKVGKENWKVRKIGQAINQAHAPKPEYDIKFEHNGL
jgi:hypothetical protein